ncbi:MAG TPA: hypothetical protein VLD18_04120, partial [Verrucomicrobiae bacterium]|nr:hypothetical protein [Verrucomicrobiae bacterium]
EPELGAVFLWDAPSGIKELLSGHFQVQPPETNNVFTLYSSSRLPVAHRMSDDGRFVALTLSARAPQAGTNVGLHGPLTTLVVRDRVNGTNGLPGCAFNQFGQFHVRDSPRQRSSRACFSADGRRLLFETRVADLGSWSYSAGTVQLWRQDLESGEAVMVSTNKLSGQVGSPGSGVGAISGDGRWIAYLSLATNLVEQDVDGRLDVYLHDCEQRTTDRISTHAAWQPSDLRQFEDAPILTPDGRFILYQAIGSGLFRHDRVTGTNALITTDVGTDRADISDDGRFVVFTARPASLDPADPNPHRNIYCHDFETGLTELVSVRDPSVPPGTPDGPTALELGAVSADGRFVAFTSQARALDPRANGSQQLW